MNVEDVAAIVVDTAFRLHRDLGPGLLESVYEVVLARMLQERGLSVERQKSVAFDFHGIHFDEGLRVDLLVNGCLVVELKSVESLAPVHSKSGVNGGHARLHKRMCYNLSDACVLHVRLSPCARLKARR